VTTEDPGGIGIVFPSQRQVKTIRTREFYIVNPMVADGPGGDL
jgi:hypothetical protein